jgi:transposase
MLKNSGMKRKDIAAALGVSEKTIERLISVSKLKGKGPKSASEADNGEESLAEEESKQ